jgi:KDO2-lipid IV(A) lauroyltransferase
MVAPSVKPSTTSSRSASVKHEQDARSTHIGDAASGLWAIRMLLLISFIPFHIRGAVGWLSGYIFGMLPSRERRIAALQLKAFLPEVSAARITPRVFANAGRTIMESLSLTPITRNFSRYVRCDSWDTVQSWIQSDRPIVTLTAHTGNWDLLAGYVIARGIPLTTIGREARSPTAQAALRWIRDGYGIETIWRSDKAGLKRLIQCLKERRVVAALIDQDTRVESIPLPFFGRSAKTPVSLITLGRKMNARFVSAFLFRTGWFSYTVFVQEIPDLPSESAILETYSQQLENLIRQYPDQWVWFHKRWRTTADGTTLSTKEYVTALEKLIRQKS